MRGQLDHTIESEVRVQRALAKLGLLALRDLSRDKLLATATEVCREALGADHCEIFEYVGAEERGSLVRAHASSPGFDSVGRMRVATDTCAGWAWRERSGGAIEDLSGEQRFRDDRLLARGVRSAIAQVISAAELDFGVIAVYWLTPQDLSEAQCQVLNDFAEVVGEGIRRRTLERTLIESEKRFRAIFETAPVGVAELDLSGGYLEANEWFCRQLGYSREELLELSFRDTVAPEFVEERDRQGERLLRGEIDVFRGESPYLDKDGKVFWGQLTLTLLRGSGGRPQRFIAIVENVDERKEAENALARQTEKLRNANRELDLFNHSVSHDLRTPLRAIDGYAQMLLEDQGDRLDERGRDYLGRVRERASRIGELLDALMELSQLERGGLRRGSVDLTGLAAAIAAEHALAEPARSVKVDIQRGMTIQGDTRYLTLALENLLDNAWKFTGVRSDPAVEVGEIEVGDRKVFFVRDNGIGFDMKFAEKLFTPFQTVHPPGQEEIGLGIGLATVKRVMRRHGGDVWAEAEPGKGATFYFSVDPEEE